MGPSENDQNQMEWDFKNTPISKQANLQGNTVPSLGRFIVILLLVFSNGQFDICGHTAFHLPISTYSFCTNLVLQSILYLYLHTYHIHVSLAGKG